MQRTRKIIFVGLVMIWVYCQCARAMTVPGDYSTLQEAINVAANGEEIKVANTFVNDMATPVWIGGDEREVIIRSYDTSFTTPTAGAQAARFDIGVTNSHVIIEGFVVDSSQAGDCALRLFNVEDIWSNSKSTWSTYEFNNLDLTANASGTWERAMFVFPSCNASTVTLSNSTLHDSLFGINIEANCESLIEGCVIEQMGDTGVIYHNDASVLGRHRIVNTTIQNTSIAGLSLFKGIDLTLDGVTIQDVGNQAIYCEAPVNLTMNNTLLQRNTNADFDGIFLTSAASGATVTMTGVTAKNFTRHGFNFDPPMTGEFTDCVSQENSGCGFVHWQTSGEVDLMFRDCEVAQNSADGFVFACPLQVTIKDSVVRDNGGAGITRWYDGSLQESSLTLEGCRIYGNQACGILGADGSQKWSINSSTISANGEGAILLNNNGTGTAFVLEASNCLFEGDTDNDYATLKLVGVGTAVEGVTDSWLNNCIIHEGLYNLHLAGGSVAMRHCTIVSDAQQTLATTISVYAEGGGHQIMNSILDGAPISIFSNGAEVALSYNLVNGSVQGVSADSSNQAGDPDFVVASSGIGTGDFHLGQNSDAIDFGENLGLLTDYDGNARLAGLAPDAGAFEYGSTPPVNSASHWMYF